MSQIIAIHGLDCYNPTIKAAKTNMAKLFHRYNYGSCMLVFLKDKRITQKSHQLFSHVCILDLLTHKHRSFLLLKHRRHTIILRHQISYDEGYVHMQ